MREADLYPPIKAYLESQGYQVKAEIGSCDVMARRGEEPPLVVELKTGFTLSLVLQGVARQKMFEFVYLAVPKGRRWPGRYADIVLLCRRLGLGLLTVRGGRVEAHLDPGPHQPRQAKKAVARLLREFDRRVGDPNIGGTTGVRRMTAYRQDALRCAYHLARGPCKAADVARLAGVLRAARLMRDDHYGWFERVSRGVYGLSPQGVRALRDHAGDLPGLLI